MPRGSSRTKAKPVSRRRYLARRIWVGVLTLSILGGAIYGVQVVVRMTGQGEDFATAAAEVARDDGFSPAVAALENVWYGYLNPPKVGGEPTTSSKFDNGSAGAASIRVASNHPAVNYTPWGAATAPILPPARLASPVKYRPGEGEWVPTKIKVNGVTAVYVAKVRPDRIHTAVYATVAWFDPHLLAFKQIPGTQLPEGNLPNRGNGRVSSTLRPFYMAAFAAGYKMDQSQGGYVNEGYVMKPLVNGKATLLTYPDGSMRIVQWGRDQVPMNFSTARQNLSLMVDHGVSQVVNKDQAQWGQVWYGTGSGHNYVWRSGLGIRADGSVVYVQSAALSAGSLANVLVRAGAVEGMALDMNQAFANGDLYGPYRPKGIPINPENQIPTTKFLKRSTRDFVAVFAKSPSY
ncbi:MAG: hypothetical protein ACKOWK_06660 [Micrococcales bacterium]